MKSPGPGPGPWRKVLVKVLADQFFKLNFVLTSLWIHQLNYVFLLPEFNPAKLPMTAVWQQYTPTPSFSVVENILHPGFISTSRTRIFSEWPYSAAVSCENE